MPVGPMFRDDPVSMIATPSSLTIYFLRSFATSSMHILWHLVAMKKSSTATAVYIKKISYALYVYICVSSDYFVAVIT